MQKVYSIKQKLFGQLYFSGRALFAEKFWMIRIACSIQWKKSGHPLFFRASAGYSKLLNNKKYLFNTVKNIRATLFFRARASCSKIMNVKSTFHTAKDFWATLFFRASAGCSKLLNNKKYMFNAVKILGQLCFSGQVQVAQKSWMIKNI